MNKPFTQPEIKQAMFETSLLKALRPDGFHTGFYQHALKSIGSSISSFALKFYETRSLPEGCNDTLITLIPKIPCPETVKQLRPIGLCNVTYKLIRKAMAIRLKVIMKKLIGPFQLSFIPERQISDNILVYQEVLNSIRTKKGRNGWMIIKVDLEKAYDRLSWNFIQRP